MAILELTQDVDNTLIYDKTYDNNYLTNMFYYILDMKELSENADKSYRILPFCAGTIKALSYNPFIQIDDFSKVCKIPYDKNYFGVGDRFSSVPSVYRIAEINEVTKTLINYQLTYDTDEPLLNMFPYTYYTIHDGYNEPLMIKANYLDYDNIEVKVRTGLNTSSKYCIYVDGYKNDYHGWLQGLINNNPILAPVTSDMYSSWWATSSAQFVESNNLARAQNHINYSQQKTNNIFNTVSNTANSLLSIKSADSIAGGAINAGLNIAGGVINNSQINENYAFTNYSIEMNANAAKKDYEKSPRGMISNGNDIIFNQQMAGNEINIVKWSMTNYNKGKVVRFLKRYGYPVNDYIFNPPINTRKSWNFIKMSKCGVKGSEVPREYLEEIKNIFERGITLWHVNRGSQMLDYSQNNDEV